MTQIEQIKAEIERLTEVTGHALSEYENGRRSAMYDIRKQLTKYINSLPAEHPSEESIKDLIQKAEELYGVKDKSFPLSEFPKEEKRQAFIKGAQWQKGQIINKACEWLNKNMVEYHPRKGELRPIVNINAFREAMEKEDEK